MLEKKLLTVSTAAKCNSCKNPQSHLILRELRSSRKGLAQRFYLLCSSCSAATYFYSGSKDKKNAFDINFKSVHANCQGTGFAGITKVAGIMDLSPPVAAKAYDNIVKTFRSNSMAAREKLLNEAANKLNTFAEINNPENIVNIDNKQVAQFAVTVDGTWKKRGHNFKICVVSILSVDTGEVLDVIVKCLSCIESNHNKIQFKSNTVEFNNWYSSNKWSCYINHEGSSTSMEAKEAAELFLHSIEKPNLMYTTFVGDWNSD